MQYKKNLGRAESLAENSLRTDERTNC